MSLIFPVSNEHLRSLASLGCRRTSHTSSLSILPVIRNLLSFPSLLRPAKCTGLQMPSGAGSAPTLPLLKKLNHLKVHLVERDFAAPDLGPHWHGHQHQVCAMPEQPPVQPCACATRGWQLWLRLETLLPVVGISVMGANWE